MTLGPRPYVRFDTTVLATWLRRQPGSWWTVDGDQWLGERISCPCPAGDLADLLDRRRRPVLMVCDATPARPSGAMVDIDQLDLLDPRDTFGGRAMTLCWDDADRQLWVLYEDPESAALYESSVKLAIPDDRHAAAAD